MNPLLDTIQVRLDDVMRNIGEAASAQNLPALEKLTKDASELQQMRTQVLAIEQRLTNLTNGSAPLNSSKVRWLRELPVQVTQGMINQNLLTLTDHVKRGAIRPGETLSIETSPSDRKFSTELLASGNKLRERGEIGRFYRDASVGPGDTVMLAELTPGVWSLKKKL